MTGTAQTEAAEFSNIYMLEVTEVPTNRPLSRTDNPDVVFRSEAGIFVQHSMVTHHCGLSSAEIWSLGRQYTY